MSNAAAEEFARFINGLDWKKLQGDLGEIVAHELLPHLKDTGADTQILARLIAKDFVIAMKQGDEAWTHELRAQTLGLLELARVKLQPATYETLEKVLGVVFKTAVVALKAAFL